MKVTNDEIAVNTLKVFHICFGDVMFYSMSGYFLSICVWKVCQCEKYKIERRLLFGNAKDFKSDDVMYVCVYMYIYIYRCWFITNIWISDHRLNMTLDTDIKLILTLNHCVDESEFCLASRLKSFEARTVWIPMGVSSDVDTRAM